MRSLIIGICVFLLVLGISLMVSDWTIITSVSGLIGVVSFLIAALLSGAFISGDRTRANWTHENNNDKKVRQNWATKLFLFGLPNIIGAIIIYFL